MIDWVPARLTSLGFAIVGNFEDAIYAWRNHARQWPDANDGVLLAAGSGALGARLSGPLAEPLSVEALAVGDASPMPVGDDCTPRTLQSAVGLVWRAVVLWMLLLLMLTHRGLAGAERSAADCGAVPAQSSSGSRAVPHCQHTVNCASSVSPH